MRPVLGARYEAAVTASPMALMATAALNRVSPRISVAVVRNPPVPAPITPLSTSISLPMEAIQPKKRRARRKPRRDWQPVADTRGRGHRCRARRGQIQDSPCRREVDDGVPRDRMRSVERVTKEKHCRMAGCASVPWVVDQCRYLLSVEAAVADAVRQANDSRGATRGAWSLSTVPAASRRVW